MRTLWQDIRYALRTLSKSWGFTITTVFVLALGIGANTAIFSVVNAILLRPLPYVDSDRIMMVWENDTQEGNAKNSIAPANFVDFKEQNSVFEELGGYTQPTGMNLTGSDEPERVRGAGATVSLFPLLKVQPARGRLFSADEGKPGANPSVIITHGLWQRSFGANPAAIDSNLMIDGAPYTIVGVLPPDFELPEKVDVFTALPLAGDLIKSRKQHFLRGLGRLKPEVSLEQSRSDLGIIARQLEQQYPDTNSGRGVTVIPVKEQFVGDVRTAILILFGAVACVLLVACANVANLLLIRGAARDKEFAIRTAMGASRWRIVRQLLVESVVLSVVGGALGLFIASWAIKVFLSSAPAAFPRGTEIGLSPMVLLFIMGVSILTGIIFGLVPALQVTKPNLNELLKEGGRSSAGGMRLNRVGRVLVVAEVAVSLLLLVCAGLMIKSFMRIQQVAPGFDAPNVLTMQISLPPAQYKKDEQVTAFYRQLQERLNGLPGVRQSGLISRLPLAGDRATASFTVEGRTAATGEELEAHYRSISPSYFRILNIPIAQGREFSDQDTETSPLVAVINQSMAQAFWPGQDPVGKRVKLGPDLEVPWTQVVGVARDARNFGLDAEAKHEVYVPFTQDPPRRARLVVRTTTEPLGLVGAVKSEVRSLDKTLSVSEVTTMEKLLSDSVAPKRFSVLLLSAFAGVALILATLGLYGVISYSVSQRSRELGLRMALGAKPRHIFHLIVGQGAKLALVGVVIGLVASLLLTRLLTSLLFGVSTIDPVVFALLAILLVGVALVACYIPARRATKIDPMVALRYE